MVSAMSVVFKKNILTHIVLLMGTLADFYIFLLCCKKSNMTYPTMAKHSLTPLLVVVVVFDTLFPCVTLTVLDLICRPG